MSKGIVRELTKQIEGLTSSGNGVYALNLIRMKNELLTNGYRTPVPARILNQRQKRKRAKW